MMTIISPPPVVETIDFPSGQRHDVLVCDEERLVIEFRVPPTDAPHVPHVHGRSDELFEVLGGRLRFTLDGLVHDLVPGDSILIPAGAEHCWQVLQPLHARVTFTPGCRFHTFLRDLAALERAGRLTGDTRPGLRDFALLQRRHWDDLRVTTMPVPVLRAAIVLGVALARLTGRRLP